ncbi:MAG: AAA family ATPase [Verrucomicrobia bacterium]|nr:AAA family ATPase [Verrucomicrobiota bacterium]
MITSVDALNYRCLRYLQQDLGSFHVLVGPNASGKTTFLDVVAFLGRLVADGLDAAVSERSQNFQDLVWNREGGVFELALEARIPEPKQKLVNQGGKHAFGAVRYEVQVGLDAESGESGIFSERVVLKAARVGVPVARNGVFPFARLPAKTILTSKVKREARTVLTKKQGGNDYFYSEVTPESGKGWFPSIKLGPKKSALGNLPEDEAKFPVATWLKSFLSVGVQQLMLNSLLIRKASPPGQSRTFKPDGSNLPWVVSDLQKRAETRVRDWIGHVQTALPDLEGLRIVDREDDRHKYLVLQYRDGLEVPSWMASDGTLRLLALTLPAYLPDLSGVFLIEEPENGIHPRAVETVFQSLSSVYGAQILMATHSPVILSIVQPRQVLCFSKTDDGATDIVNGSEHPALKDGRGETNLGVLFAGGVLG